MRAASAAYCLSLPFTTVHTECAEPEHEDLSVASVTPVFDVETETLLRIERLCKRADP